MLKDAIVGWLLYDPAVSLFFLQYARLHFQILQLCLVASIARRCQRLDGVRRILNRDQMHRLQVGELIEDVEELSDAEVQLHLVLANELNVVED